MINFLLVILVVVNQKRAPSVTQGSTLKTAKVIASVDPNLNSFSVANSGSMTSVRIPEMTTITGEMQGFLTSLGQTSGVKPLLIDLRHNRGGENDFAEALEKVLKTAQQPLVTLKRADKKSLLSYVSFANHWYDEWKSLFDEGEDASSPKAGFLYMQEVVKDLRQDFTFAQVEEQIEAGDQGHGQRSSAFNKPIVVLYDKQCASACESVIDRLKSLSNVTLVGVPSFGAMHISQAGRLWLPNSHILVKAGFERWIYPSEIDAPEGFGHEPDFYIIESDPTKVLELAKKKLLELAN
jgi:C-terminal processing protease CtpA/Prc